MADTIMSKEEIDNLLNIVLNSGDFKKESGFDDMKDEIKKLQEEIEKLKSENKKLKENAPEKIPDVFEEYRVELDEHLNAIVKLMDKVFDENQNKVDALAVCISKTRNAFGGGNTSIVTACWKAIEELHEEGFAAACEVFTNPRRISILKILAKEKLTASEIGQKTGLVGGQLYHHLASLENSGFIKKIDDKYETTPDVQGLLIKLYACLGSTKIARE